MFLCTGVLAHIEYCVCGCNVICSLFRRCQRSGCAGVRAQGFSIVCKEPIARVLMMLWASRYLRPLACMARAPRREASEPVLDLLRQLDSRVQPHQPVDWMVRAPGCEKLPERRITPVRIDSYTGNTTQALGNDDILCRRCKECRKVAVCHGWRKFSCNGRPQCMWRWCVVALSQVWAAVMATPFISDAVQQHMQERASALHAPEEKPVSMKMQMGKGGKVAKEQEESAAEADKAPEGCRRCHRLKMLSKPMAAFRCCPPFSLHADQQCPGSDKLSAAGQPGVYRLLPYTSHDFIGSNGLALTCVCDRPARCPPLFAGG